MRGGCDVDSAARAYFNGWLNLCLFRDELFKDIVNISLRSGEELRSIGVIVPLFCVRLEMLIISPLLRVLRKSPNP